MDTLHSVMRSIRPQAKSSADHLTVFREFLAHLGRINRKAPPAKPARRKTARRGAAKR